MLINFTTEGEFIYCHFNHLSLRLRYVYSNLKSQELLRIPFRNISTSYETQYYTHCTDVGPSQKMMGLQVSIFR